MRTAPKLPRVTRVQMLEEKKLEVERAAAEGLDAAVRHSKFWPSDNLSPLFQGPNF